MYPLEYSLYVDKVKKNKNKIICGFSQLDIALRFNMPPPPPFIFYVYPIFPPFQPPLLQTHTHTHTYLLNTIDRKLATLYY